MNTKPWYQSKTLWFNVLTLVVAVAAGFGFAEFEPNQEVITIAGGVVALVNLALRLWFTDKKLTR